MITDPYAYRWTVVKVLRDGSRKLSAEYSKRGALNHREMILQGRATIDDVVSAFLWPDGKESWETIDIDEALRIQLDHQEPFDWQPRFHIYLLVKDGVIEERFKNVSMQAAKEFWSNWNSEEEYRSNATCILYPTTMPPIESLVAGGLLMEADATVMAEEVSDEELNTTVVTLAPLAVSRDGLALTSQ